MIFEGKDLDLETLMIQLELENKANVDNVLSRREGNGRFLWDIRRMKLNHNCKV
jgi:hypothetical protein